MLIVGALFWLRLAGAATTDAASGFDSANRLYEQGKFSEAAGAYEALLQSGSISPALYFNLGNARYKSGDVGRAMMAYRTAERLAPRDPDVRANLQFVRNQIQGPKLPPGRWQQWLARLTINEWTVLTAIALWFWLLPLVLAQWRPGWKPTLRGFILTGGIATLVLGICLGAALSAASARTAIVTARDTAVRNGPFDESPTAFTVHDGAELGVLDQKEEWLQVTAGNRIGWLKRDHAALLH